MWRTLVLAALLLSTAVLVWEAIPIEKIDWVGGYELSVNVSNNGGPFCCVSCEAFAQRDEAEFTLQHLLPPVRSNYCKVSAPFDGQPLLVYVPINGRDSPFGRELSRSQFRFLVVIGQLEDGKRIGKLVEIPDSRVTRSINVSFP